MCGEPARAHTVEECDEITQQLQELAMEATQSLTSELLEEVRAYVQEWRDSCSPHQERPADSSGNRSSIAGVEQWRSLVAIYFAPEHVNTALCLMGYESGGDPTAASATNDHGLMQVHWPIWGPAFNLSKQDLYDPGTNLATAAKIRGIQGWWAWSPYKRGRCR